MDAALNNQVIKLKCRYCTAPLAERIASLKGNPKFACSPCETAVQSYADLLRAELARIDQALADHRQKLDDALWKDWRALTGQSS
ncbi:hypothetical protein [Polaromonas naphthalenivorans]|uniref:Uncharacterized protein n=1 Tax=Polaromonas naphthalenivorans (strain CJ2) TaxID=365044 RepID=A1VPJ3_POLNA|nr:hypothetical protein [Polaromonas naphthalenivorans]ABM37571.1 hypothetical protein Pnap_2263 [Polaromonas naphthalenivorans CJ2]